MPEATPTTTLTSSGVVTGFLPPGAADRDGELTFSMQRRPAEQELLLACESAKVRGETMRLLTQALAAMPSNSPRYTASYAFLDQLRVDWVARLARVAAIPSQGSKGMTAKATLLAAMIERDSADRVQGPPEVQLAASLADDILVHADD